MLTDHLWKPNRWYRLIPAACGTFTALDMLLGLVFLGVTVQLSVFHTWPLEIALVEIVLVLALGAHAWGGPGGASVRYGVGMRRLMVWLVAWALWATLLWLLGRDWLYNLNEIRWLAFACLACHVAYVACRQSMARSLALFAVVSIVAALVADIQGATGAFVPPFAAETAKYLELSSGSGLLRSVAVGLFRHPNAYGGFVFWPMSLGLGLVAHRRWRLAGIAGFVFFLGSLYLSYYRTLILGVMIAIGLFILVRLRVRPASLAWMIALALLGTVALSAIALQVAPQLSFFENLWYRVELWREAGRLIVSNPAILAWGSGYRPDLALAVARSRIDPHNAYLYTLMHFGLPGLAVFLGAWLEVIRQGWREYRRDRFLDRPVLGAMWIASIVWMFSGLMDSHLTSSEWVVLSAVMLGLLAAGFEGRRAVAGETVSSLGSPQAALQP